MDEAGLRELAKTMAGGKEIPDAPTHPDHNPKEFDLYKVDYNWVDRCVSIKELKKAIQALDEDRGFPDLLMHCQKRMKVLDPKYLTEAEKNYVSASTEKEANDDILDFLSSQNEHDQALKRESNKENIENKSIFSNAAK